MRLTHLPGAPHLMYCTNIHAGERWDEVSASLRDYVPAIRAALGQPAPFAIGLRLSAQAAGTLAQAPVLHDFQRQLAHQQAYVPSINAFPYGVFHGKAVKQDVYLPDWHSDQRLGYTRQCADILAALLPPDVNGSISTVPGAFKLTDQLDKGQIASRIIQLVAHLAGLERSSGKRIALALEPEPCCMLETVQETIDFFQDHLFTLSARADLAKLAGVSNAQAESLLRRHVGVCYDVCHGAVEFENPLSCMRQLTSHGIAIPKIQLSCAVRIPDMRDDLAAALQQFEDGVYLHQVVVRDNDKLSRYVDLPDAFKALKAGQAEGEWRIHCHVPVYLARLAAFESTQAELLNLLAGLKTEFISSHLEVETYTWDVLPDSVKAPSKAAAIANELRFIMEAVHL